MSDRRRFLKGLTSLPLATVLANPPQFLRDYKRLRPVEAARPAGNAMF